MLTIFREGQTYLKLMVYGSQLIPKIERNRVNTDVFQAILSNLRDKDEIRDLSISILENVSRRFYTENNIFMTFLSSN